MRRAQNVIGLCLAFLVLLGVFGLWLWGKPRTTVAIPPTSAAPAQVVRTFAHALNERDYSTAKAMVVGDKEGVDAAWWDLHGPRVEELRIISTGPVTTGRKCDSDTAGGWKQCVVVDTTSTFRHVKGLTKGDKPTHEPWTYYLVRNGSSQHWRILDWAKG